MIFRLKAEGLTFQWGRRRSIVIPTASEGHSMKWTIRVELTRIPTPLTARQVIKRALRMEAAQLLRITAILALIAGLHSHGTA